FVLIKGFQICNNFHKSRSPFTHTDRNESHKMSPSLQHQPWQAVKKLLTSLAKICSPFLTTCAIHSFQPQQEQISEHELDMEAVR
ncbi:LOW QUALITY PROTEIN: uncharacterized protein ACNFOS_011945, partial [Eudromia elegans]